jgi:hypothetical protein
LVVIAIIAVVAVLLVPALSAARAKQVACINHLKQLALAGQMYAADNEGKLASNPRPSQTNSWAAGNMKDSLQATNDACLRQGKFFAYTRSSSIYRCPAAAPQSGEVPPVRSYSMNGWMGSRDMEAFPGQKNFRTFVKESEVAMTAPAALWMLADEHESTIDDAFFLVTMDDSRLFASFPGTRHRRSYCLSFADGHVEAYKLRDPNTHPTKPQPGGVSSNNPDWIKLKQATTTEWGPPAQ